MALCGKKEQLPNLSPIVSVRRAFNASMTSFVASLFTLYDFNEGSASSSLSSSSSSLSSLSPSSLKGLIEIGQRFVF